jgi:hypothetical protein
MEVFKMKNKNFRLHTIAIILTTFTLVTNVDAAEYRTCFIGDAVHNKSINAYIRDSQQGRLFPDAAPLAVKNIKDHEECTNPANTPWWNRNHKLASLDITFPITVNHQKAYFEIDHPIEIKDDNEGIWFKFKDIQIVEYGELQAFSIDGNWGRCIYKISYQYARHSNRTGNDDWATGYAINQHAVYNDRARMFDIIPVPLYCRPIPR